MKKFTLLSLLAILLLWILIFTRQEERVKITEKEEVEKIESKLSDRFKTFRRMAKTPIADLPVEEAWNRLAPEVKAITIKSSMDDTNQPALYYDSGSKRKKPLLIILHSWSVDYKQYYSIPYALWAIQNDYVFIQPDFRGSFVRPEATASELVIQDILDALQYARKNANIDETRIYLEGYSGGAMLSLILAGRFPEIWAGVVAWVPVYDLVDWYQTTKNSNHNYSKHIVNSCGGVPLPGSEAENECKRRSPSQYLKNARDKKVKIFIAAGIKDRFVPPSHALNAYNDLAKARHQLTESEISEITNDQKIPIHLVGNLNDQFFEEVGLTLLLERHSANVVLKIFDGNHDIVYHASLFWLSRQKK